MDDSIPRDSDLPSPEVEAAWEREIVKRLADYDSGIVTSISSVVVHSEISRKLNENKNR